ncbi:MAG: DUF2079 domain-containing protein [Planctomycetaceae bacterium]|nr:DUF2079 domain-containing protein [Planctomycetaceae bacterium]MBT6485225.1 DUF2079 domain-containing protein [Planctomycetaceae bacterium]
MKSPTDRVDRLGVIAQGVFGALCAAGSLQVILNDYALAGTLMSRELWMWVTGLLGGKVSPTVDVPLDVLFFAFLGVAIACWLGGAAALTAKTKAPFSNILWVWGRDGFRWWLIFGVWLLLWTVASIAEWETAVSLLAATPQLWLAVTMAGFVATLFAMSISLSAVAVRSVGETNWYVPKSVGLGIVIYVIVFTTMNWQLHRGLLLPHGDSAMYEEHLWNLEYGKGFRSFLDPGLFLGEHIQVIHVALLPLHVVWPSQMLLELCESLALASGAIAVFWIARRHTRSDKAGALLAFAYLLYFPMQFLDIAIDLKTFRPIAFGVPLLLFALDQMERRRFVSMSVLLLCVLSAKEDFAIVIAPLGLWLLCRGAGVDRSLNQPAYADRSPERPARMVGGAMAVLSVCYLLLVLLVLIPAFREGRDPHYTGYFGWLHEAAVEEGISDNGMEPAGPLGIAQVLFAQPTIWLGRLFSMQSLFYALALLVPIGFLALFSPGRLAVALPLFGVLCLMEVSGGGSTDAGFPLVPFHHFHAPLIPIVIWASAAGLSHAAGFWRRLWGRLRRTKESIIAVDPTLWTRHFVWTSALAGGLFFSLGPLGVPFWDAGSTWTWRSLYVPGERAEEFPAVFAMIPASARVASTDLIHPRFTHHERSYDYSAYPRAVNDNKPGAPPDTDYIVIDKQARYSNISQPEQIREFREHPYDWKLLLNNDFFIVLQRKNEPSK